MLCPSKGHAANILYNGPDERLGIEAQVNEGEALIHDLAASISNDQKCPRGDLNPHAIAGNRS